MYAHSLWLCGGDKTNMKLVAWRGKLPRALRFLNSEVRTWCGAATIDRVGRQCHKLEVGECFAGYSDYASGSYTCKAWCYPNSLQLKSQWRPGQPGAVNEWGVLLRRGAATTFRHSEELPLEMGNVSTNKYSCMDQPKEGSFTIPYIDLFHKYQCSISPMTTRSYSFGRMWPATQTLSTGFPSFIFIFYHFWTLHCKSRASCLADTYTIIFPIFYISYSL